MTLAKGPKITLEKWQHKVNLLNSMDIVKEHERLYQNILRIQEINIF